MQWEVYLGFTGAITESKLRVGRDGFIYIGKEGFGGLEVSRVSQQGVVMWSNIFIPCDFVADMVTDDSCFVYIIGTRNLDSTLIAKIDSAGNHIWTASYNYLTGSYDRASSLTVDRNGRVYAATYSSNGLGQWCSAITKFSNTGQAQWNTRFCPSGYGKIPELIRIYNDTMLIVVGEDIPVQGESDIFVQRLDTSGNILWTKYFDTDSAMGLPYNRRDSPKDMIITRSGKIVIVAEGADSGMPAWVNLFYDADGNLIWWREDFPSYADVNSVVEDPQGNLIFGGSTNLPSNQYVIAATKYDTTGTRNWMMTYAPLNYGHATEGYATVDSAGNVFVTGLSWTPTTGLFFTMKFSYMVSVDEVNQEPGINVYPNPATERLTFQFGYASDSREIVLLNQLGQVVSRNSAPDVQGEINVTTLSSGVYYYKVMENNAQVATGQIAILE